MIVRYDLVDRLYMQAEEPPFLTAPPNISPSTENTEAPPRKKKSTGENFYLKVSDHEKLTFKLNSIIHFTF